MLTPYIITVVIDIVDLLKNNMNKEQFKELILKTVETFLVDRDYNITLQSKLGYYGGMTNIKSTLYLLGDTFFQVFSTYDGVFMQVFPVEYLKGYQAWRNHVLNIKKADKCPLDEVWTIELEGISIEEASEILNSLEDNFIEQHLEDAWQ